MEMLKCFTKPFSRPFLVSYCSLIVLSCSPVVLPWAKPAGGEFSVSWQRGEHLGEVVRWGKKTHPKVVDFVPGEACSRPILLSACWYTSDRRLEVSEILTLTRENTGTCCFPWPPPTQRYPSAYPLFKLTSSLPACLPEGFGVPGLITLRLFGFPTLVFRTLLRIYFQSLL